MADNEITRAAAQNALDAYMASEGMVDDPETAIVDLIADLAFLADSLDLHGGYVLAQGARHYEADIAEGFSDQHGEADDEDDFELRGPESIDADRPQLTDGYGHSINPV